MLAPPPNPPAVTKRLSFGDVSEEFGSRQQAAVSELLQEGQDLSMESLAQALRAVREAQASHLSGVQEMAVQASDEVGEADLRRLKRQFSSLKNTFIHFETKEAFLAALLDGLPDGSESEQLAQYESELAATVSTLRSVKAANKGTQEEIVTLISRIESLRDAFDNEAAGLAAFLDRCVAEEGEGSTHSSLHPHAPAPDSPRRELAEAQAALAASQTEAQALESAVLQQQEEALEAESRAERLRGEAELAEARLEHARRRQSAHGRAAAEETRARDAAAWAGAGASFLEALSGVTIRESAATRGELALDVRTACPAGPVGEADPLQNPDLVLERASHAVRLRLSNSGRVESVAVEGPEGSIVQRRLAQLLSDDGDESKTLALPEALLHARLCIAEVLHASALEQGGREALRGVASVRNVEEAARVWEVSVEGADAGLGLFRLQLAGCWPRPGGDLWVAADGEPPLLRGFCVRGCSLAQAVEAAVRRLRMGDEGRA